MICRTGLQIESQRSLVLSQTVRGTLDFPQKRCIECSSWLGVHDTSSMQVCQEECPETLFCRLLWPTSTFYQVTHTIFKSLGFLLHLPKWRGALVRICSCLSDRLTDRDIDRVRCTRWRLCVSVLNTMHRIMSAASGAVLNTGGESKWCRKLLIQMSMSDLQTVGWKTHFGYDLDWPDWWLADTSPWSEFDSTCAQGLVFVKQAELEKFNNIIYDKDKHKQE